MKSKFIKCILLCVFGILSTQAQSKTTTLIQSTDEDERIGISIDKSVHFPGDTVLLVIQRNDTVTAGIIPSILLIEGTTIQIRR